MSLRALEIIKSGPEYNLIKQEYKKIIDKNITREKDYNKFIGGLPITLERNDLFTLISKNVSNHYRYTVTQKVDGIRMLLFAFSSSLKMTDGRIIEEGKIVLIDRENNYYKIKNNQNQELPPYTGSNLLIDGELIIFLKETAEKKNVFETSTNMNEQFMNIQSYSYMAFDMLYGPNKIIYEGLGVEKKLLIGTLVSMAGPVGGRQWTYYDRYDILYKLIIPNKEFNDNRPMLTLYTINLDWFTIELKPLYSIENFKDIKTISYKDIDGWFQKQLIIDRNTNLKKINEIKTKKSKYYPVNLDGLIFTPYDTEYVIGGAWKKFLNIQFKWKPPEDQTIDFQVKIVGSIKKLQVLKNNNLFIFKINKDKDAETFSNVKNNDIGEFKFNKLSQKFDLLRLRNDKKTPNSLITAINVWRSIIYPVNIENIKELLSIKTLKSDKIRSYLIYLNKSQLLSCIFSNKNQYLVNEINKDHIYNLIKEYKINKNYEFELRLGYKEPDRFQTNIPFIVYKNIIDILVNINIKYTFSNIIDIFDTEKKIRSRYIYISELKYWKLEDTIIKNNITNIDIDLKYIYNFDVRFSLSEEKEIVEQRVEFETNKNTKKILKDRYSFIMYPIQIDCTEIFEIIDSKKTNIKYLVEFEIIDKTANIDLIYKKIMYTIKFILQQIQF